MIDKNVWPQQSDYRAWRLDTLKTLEECTETPALQMHKALFHTRFIKSPLLNSHLLPRISPLKENKSFCYDVFWPWLCQTLLLLWVVRVKEGPVPDTLALKNKRMFALFSQLRAPALKSPWRECVGGCSLSEVSLAPSCSRTGMMCSQKYIVYWLLSSHRRRVLQCTN